MNSICVATGCLDVQTPGPIKKISFKKLYQWPESEAEFLNKLIITMNEETSSSSTSSSYSSAVSASPCFSHQKVPSSIDHHESFVCRQRYLKSYTFSKQKETVTEKTKRWIKEKQKKKKKKHRNNIHHHEEKSKDQKNSFDHHDIGSGGGNGSNPCSSFKSAFLFLLSSFMVKVDVHDEL